MSKTWKIERGENESVADALAISAKVMQPGEMVWVSNDAECAKTRYATPPQSDLFQLAPLDAATATPLLKFPGGWRHVARGGDQYDRHDLAAYAMGVGNVVE